MHAAVWSAKTNFQNVLIDDVDGRHATSSPTSTTKVRGPISGGVFARVNVGVVQFFIFFKIHSVGGSKFASKTAVHFPTSGPFQRNFDVRTRKPEEMQRFEACCFYSF